MLLKGVFAHLEILGRAVESFCGIRVELRLLGLLCCIAGTSGVADYHPCAGTPPPFVLAKKPALSVCSCPCSTMFPVYVL